MSLAYQLLAAGERHPEATIAQEGAERRSAAAFLAEVQALAGGLGELGVGPGSRVMVCARNRLETLLFSWATWWLGACLAPVNWRLPAPVVARLAEDAEARVFAACDAGSQAAATLGEQRLPLVALDPGAPGIPLAELRRAGRIEEPVGVDDRQTALLLYTSGTTGLPKGVVRSHRAEWQAALAHVIQTRMVPGDRTLGVMPWCHTMGQRSLLATVVLDGCLVVQRSFDPAKALELVAQEAIGSLYLAPTLYHDLVVQAERQDLHLQIPRLASAGAPLSPGLVRRLVERFSPEVVVNHYGSSEVYTVSIGPDQRAKPGCAGRPGLHARIRLVEPQAEARPDQLVGPGETGLILVSLDSPEAFDGYWHRPEADRQARRDGWYVTGDLGRLDEDGDLWIVGRLDDMIVTGGENVHPTEVEEVLAAHPAVQQVAVIGLPDERLGQLVTACVVAPGADPQALVAELDAYCRASPALAGFQRPRRFVVLDRLPVTASGKLQRSELRRQLAGDPGSPSAPQGPTPQDPSPWQHPEPNPQPDEERA